MNRNNETMSSFKRLVALLPSKWMLITSLFVILVEVAAEIYITYTIRRLLDFAIERNIAMFINSSIAMLLSIFVVLMCIYTRKRLLGTYSAKGIAFLRLKALEHINNLKVSKFEENHTGDYISRLTNDISKLEAFTKDTLFQLLYLPTIAVASFVYLLSLSWKLTSISVLIYPILFFGITLLNKPIANYSRAAQENLSVINSFNQDFITGSEIARSFNLKKLLTNKYKGAVGEWRKSSERVVLRQALTESFSNLVGLAPFFVTFGIGGYYTINGEITLGALMAFIFLLNNLTNPLSILPGSMVEAKKDMASASRIFEIMDMEVEKKDGASFDIDEAKCAVEFKSVSFKYGDKGGHILNNLSFKINKGERVALVGPSGSGKTTIFKLLMSYYTDFDGDINVFENNLVDWNPEELRKKIAMVSQDTHLFPDTLMDNIGYGNLQATDTEIVNASTAAYANDFIKSFDKGYNTKAGELGSRLSGGQKQRISIARAILKNAPILLLDEATSALDNQSEELVEKALEAFMDNRTTLIIAHRLSTIKNANRILVIDNGTIVEEGNHQKLIKAKGLYSRLYTTQLAVDSSNELEVS